MQTFIMLCFTFLTVNFKSFDFSIFVVAILLFSPGNPLMRGPPPPSLMREAGGPPHEGSFHFASRFPGERTISAKNYKNYKLRMYTRSSGAWELSSPDSFGGGGREVPLAHIISRAAQHRSV